MDAKKNARKQKSTENNTGADREEEVPIVMPRKKAKVEKPTKKGLVKVPKPTGGKVENDQEGCKNTLTKYEKRST
ncbi:uncharacterized protein LOC118402969 [Oncorhynchus keta]|uniref:uncharacterized protein LOC118402969 n=1 Tax=Oncorhynchus keta TaxID=8018 RepID=UPI00227C751C|nr:uncharacterized protein LOC118402969 [Oncorhynchus keta]